MVHNTIKYHVVISHDNPDNHETLLVPGGQLLYVVIRTHDEPENHVSAYVYGPNLVLTTNFPPEFLVFGGAVSRWSHACSLGSSSRCRFEDQTPPYVYTEIRTHDIKASGLRG